jgi:hypothetical protein
VRSLGVLQFLAYLFEVFVYNELKLCFFVASGHNIFVTALFIILLVSTMSNLKLCEVSGWYSS